ncbi:hypothetical protein CF328_g4697 [Tilletia controversa]|nr:hypothetical protein CF328_g4697 [Tilletia controversa]
MNNISLVSSTSVLAWFIVLSVLSAVCKLSIEQRTGTPETSAGLDLTAVQHIALPIPDVLEDLFPRISSTLPATT